jgi:hypothetical protein
LKLQIGRLCKLVAAPLRVNLMTMNFAEAGAIGPGHLNARADRRGDGSATRRDDLVLVLGTGPAGFRAPTGAITYIDGMRSAPAIAPQALSAQLRDQVAAVRRERARAPMGGPALDHAFHQPQGPAVSLTRVLRPQSIG